MVAVPTPALVYVDGSPVGFDAYNIAGSNYIKLRDLAYAFSGTAKQFAVEQESLDRVSLISNQQYTAVGRELNGRGREIKTAQPGNISITLDGSKLTLNGYMIDGNDYLKLRDLGQALNFGIFWDEVKKAIYIETGLAYAQNNDPIADIQAYYGQEIVRLVNAERVKNGLKPLAADRALFQSAQARAAEVQQKFSHTRPNGRHWNSILNDSGIEYVVCAENLGLGQADPQQIMKEWLASPGHLQNILGDFDKIGVGVLKIAGSSPRYAWVQHFVKSK